MDLKTAADAVITAYGRGERCPPETESALRAALPAHPSCPASCPLRGPACVERGPCRGERRKHLAARPELLDAR